jgi:hypothetical protein
MLVSGPGFAEPAKERGGYIGGGLGATMFDDGGAFAFFNQDDSDSGFGVFGGYKFFRYFAIEGRYTDLGSFSVGGLNFDASIVSAHAIGIIPFGGSGWELFGQLGLGSLDVELPGSSSGNEAVGSAGAGVRFSPTRHFSLALQLDAWAYEDTSLGRAYDIGFGSTSLTFRYIF